MTLIKKNRQRMRCDVNINRHSTNHLSELLPKIPTHSSSRNIFDVSIFLVCLPNSIMSFLVYPIQTLINRANKSSIYQKRKVKVIMEADAEAWLTNENVLIKAN